MPRLALIPKWDKNRLAMRVIAVSTLVEFWSGRRETRAAARPALAWYHEAVHADWAGPTAMKAQFRGVRTLRGGRAVFSVGAGTRRIVVRINYPHRIVCIRFVGSHAQYDAIYTPTLRGSGMDIKPIRTKADYRAALEDIESLMDAKPKTPTGDRLEVLATLIAAYERAHFPMDLPDAVDAIKFRMEQQNLTVKDLEPAIGRSNRVYEVLARKRPLTLRMIVGLHEKLGIPAESLIRQRASDPQ